MIRPFIQSWKSVSHFEMTSRFLVFFGNLIYIYLSAHSAGTALEYLALTQTNRATTYISLGTYANYVGMTI